MDRSYKQRPTFNVYVYTYIFLYIVNKIEVNL